MPISLFLMFSESIDTSKNFLKTSEIKQNKSLVSLCELTLREEEQEQVISLLLKVVWFYSFNYKFVERLPPRSIYIEFDNQNSIVDVFVSVDDIELSNLCIRDLGANSISSLRAEIECKISSIVSVYLFFQREERFSNAIDDRIDSYITY